MNNEDFVSYEMAQALARRGYDGQYDYMQATENFCYGDNPISFDTISVGERIPECVAYYVNDDNEDAYRGILCPSLTQTQKWLREKHGWQIIIIPHRWKGLVFDYILWHTMRGYENKNQGYNFSSYESALAAGIDAALKLIEA